MNTEQTLDRLAAILSDSSQVIVQEYAKWYMTDAIVAIVVSIIAFVLLWKVALKKALEYEKDYVDDFFKFLAIGLVCYGLFLSVMIAASNIATVINPKAKAITELIKSIRRG